MGFCQNFDTAREAIRSLHCILHIASGEGRSEHLTIHTARCDRSVHTQRARAVRDQRRPVAVYLVVSGDRLRLYRVAYLSGRAEWGPPEAISVGGMTTGFPSAPQARSPAGVCFFVMITSFSASLFRFPLALLRIGKPLLACRYLCGTLLQSILRHVTIILPGAHKVNVSNIQSYQGLCEI
jgi:hypothetical protein